MSASAEASAQAPKADDRDYLDKGVEAGLKKYGGAKFQDSRKNRATVEKITDFLRKMFEKATGKKVPEKISN